MIIALSLALTIGVLIFTLFVRKEDIPEPIPVSPLQHLEDRKAAIYDNLRDLQFEYRLGKLSDGDYQQTKLTLQKELAGVLAEMEETASRLGLATKRTSPLAKGASSKTKAPAAAIASSVCKHCGAEFTKTMKFCGGCGKARA